MVAFRINAQKVVQVEAVAVARRHVPSARPENIRNACRLQGALWSMSSMPRSDLEVVLETWVVAPYHVVVLLLRAAHARPIIGLWATIVYLPAVLQVNPPQSIRAGLLSVVVPLVISTRAFLREVLLVPVPAPVAPVSVHPVLTTPSSPPTTNVYSPNVLQAIRRRRMLN